MAQFEITLLLDDEQLREFQKILDAIKTLPSLHMALQEALDNAEKTDETDIPDEATRDIAIALARNALPKTRTTG